MVWHSGETITANRLIDMNNNLIDGSIFNGFNLLKIAVSGNIFNTTINGTGSVTFDNASGCIICSTPADNDDAIITEQSQEPLTGLPRIGIFNINTLNQPVNTEGTIAFGFGNGILSSNAFVGIKRLNATSNWFFETDKVSSKTQSSTGLPVAGDLYVIYATSGQCSLFKNNEHNATHTTNIPTSGLGHMVGIQNSGTLGAGNKIILDFMR